MFCLDWIFFFVVVVVGLHASQKEHKQGQWWRVCRCVRCVWMRALLFFFFFFFFFFCELTSRLRFLWVSFAKGYIPSSDLGNVLRAFGHNPTESELQVRRFILSTVSKQCLWVFVWAYGCLPMPVPVGVPASACLLCSFLCFCIFFVKANSAAHTITRCSPSAVVCSQQQELLLSVDGGSGRLTLSEVQTCLSNFKGGADYASQVREVG